MKTFLIILTLSVVAIFTLPTQTKEENFSNATNKKYRNIEFKYEIDQPSGYVINAGFSELVILEKDDTSIRINAGCFDFGTEPFTQTQETINFNGIDALKVNYYYQSHLKMQRISFDNDGKCFALEVQAESEGDWAEATEIVKTFQFFD